MKLKLKLSLAKLSRVKPSLAKLKPGSMDKRGAGMEHGGAREYSLPEVTTIAVRFPLGL